MTASGLLPSDVEGFESLAELALNMRWSWNHATDALWRRLDPALWEQTGNPWVVLQTVSRDSIRKAMDEPRYRQDVDALLATRRAALAAPAWYQQARPEGGPSCIAYFCMEFMLNEALPIYSGGLGNVAGDQLKAASDLGVPVVGVGLLYQQGYFRQVINQNGEQEALYPYNDPGQLPVTPLRLADGQWLRLEIPLPGYSIWLRAWEVRVGRVRLYLLDSNCPENLPVHRGLTAELYGGGPELRIRQEMLLGLGGWRLLAALGLRPEVCHLNEGHAAFAVLERAHAFMGETGLPFAAALAATRPGNVFTTHTAVAAGFDRFSPDLVRRVLGHYAQARLGLQFRDFMALGRLDPEDANEPFNMAYLAIRGSGRVNGVSGLHGQVSRRLFAPLFPRWPADEVPVGHVTNGVHMPSWDSAVSDEVWTRACGKGRWLGTMVGLEEKMLAVPDAELWSMRCASRALLARWAGARLARQLAASGAPPEASAAAEDLLDPDALTLGFARRFATYKRPNLLLQDPERLLRILNNAGRPVQLILAGKAHPQDLAGQALIHAWNRFIRGPGAGSKILFLGDYDMQLTEQMVQGVDVWINTPRRPWEACGTSGMKVLVNGGLNLSELDGWWAEAYTPAVGWALGDGLEHGDDPGVDAREAGRLYDLLEGEVVPDFYARDAAGIPLRWVKRMRESMARLTPRYSADRAVREYVQQHYLPAARSYRERSAEKGAEGAALLAWSRRLDSAWPGLVLGPLQVVGGPGVHAFTMGVRLGRVDPDAVRFELFAEGRQGGPPERKDLQREAAPAGSAYALLLRATVPDQRPAGDYSARALPWRPGAAIPLESAHIAWSP